MPVPNQKVITVNKAPTDVNNIYVKINIDAIEGAIKSLTPAQFKVWLYFAKNQNGYTLELSKVAVMEFCNVSEKTYKEAIKEMVEQRYLVKRADGSNKYDFYEKPFQAEMPTEGALIECHTTTEFVF